MNASVSPPEKQPLKRDDFISDQQVRWCPGCGDYAILASMQRMLAKVVTAKEEHVFISGIGCSSRFPYYMNTYGFHTIHGRAPTIATGLKCVNSKLNVWVITGDGDGLSIGGNHLVHAMRRNININIILVNNRIYGLTKGQYSPTSEAGKVTGSSPAGSIDYPINPLCVTIASEATFIARTMDVDPKHMSQVLQRALEHKGTSFVEIYQNCNIFNNGAFEHLSDRAVREKRLIYLEHGKPLSFGKDSEKVITIKGLNLRVADNKDIVDNDVVIHDETSAKSFYAYLLTQMEYPEMPVPFGVLRAIDRPTYDDKMTEQIDLAVKKKGPGSLKDLIHGDQTWEVKKPITSKG